jgi:DNA-binding GntR family transcriptional regulator
VEFAILKSGVVPNGQSKTRNRSLTEAAYDLIKIDIVHCVLEPGGQVTEEQLAEKYSVGRAAVRAALNRLCQEKLVKLQNRRGYYVAPITLKHVSDIFQLRLVLEPAAARLAAGRVDGELLFRLNELCRAEYQTGDSDSAAAFLSTNTEFHLVIAEATNNELIYDTLAALFSKVERAHHLGHTLHDRNAEALHEHTELVEALVTGDAERAEVVMAAQIRAAERFIIDAMVASPSLQLVNVTNFGVRL